MNGKEIIKIILKDLSNGKWDEKDEITKEKIFDKWKILIEKNGTHTSIDSEKIIDIGGFKITHGGFAYELSFVVRKLFPTDYQNRTFDWQDIISAIAVESYNQGMKRMEEIMIENLTKINK